MKGLLYKEFCLLRKNLLFLLGMIVFFQCSFFYWRNQHCDTDYVEYACGDAGHELVQPG